MPLDYSILEEIEYQYPARDAYYAYMTRGYINKCDFCAVPVLEPRYHDYIPFRKEIEATKERFGEQRNLLLLDNNVLASKRYNDIIDEIKSCGFAKNDKYTPPNEYEIAIRNLRDGYNDRGYINKCIKLYRLLLAKTKEADIRREIYARVEAVNCLQSYTATKEAIFSLDDFMHPFFQKMYNGKKLMRIADFNQGIDSRLVNDANMAKLAEVNIRPLRIAFDHWELRHVYEKAIRTAVAHGITSLSNYLLYNFRGKPEELYYRMEINVRLCEELNATIYSFPMKYHPIKDPNYFRNRDYIGVHWNRKFIRAIQAVLNSTKGKIGRGKSFFQAAFGENVDEFYKI